MNPLNPKMMNKNEYFSCKTYRIVRNGSQQHFGYVFGETIHIALARAKILHPWVRHHNLKLIKYK